MIEPKVLHILEALEGGTARHVVDLVVHAHNVNHHVAIPKIRSVGVTDIRAREAIEAAGGTVHPIEMHRSPIRMVNLRAITALAGLVRRERPDVVHGHSSMGGVFARILPGGAPRVYTPNGIPAGPGATLVERSLGLRTSVMVLVSESERQLAQELRLTAPSRMLVIPNGIDLQPPRLTIDLHKLLGLASEVPLVGTIARLCWQKAPERFMRMCELVAEKDIRSHFVLVGDGKEQAIVNTVGAKLGNRFHHLPSLPFASAALGSLSVFVLLSRFEGAPYAPLEAARAGVPLVLTDVVGCRDVVENSRSGFVVSEPDTEHAAECVLTLLNDRKVARALVANMSARLNAQFDVRQQGVAHKELYERLARP